MRRLGWLLLLAGCTKVAAPAPDASAESVAVAASDAAPPAADASAAPTGGAARYTGAYSLAPAAMYIADTKDFGNVKQVKDDPSKHVGDGTLTLAVAADGKVTGAIETGPASPATLDGNVVDDEIRAIVRRKTPADDGLTGTLTASPKGGSGTLSLAEANAAIVRAGKLSLKRE